MRFVVAFVLAFIGTEIAGQIALHDLASGVSVGLIIFIWVSQTMQTASAEPGESLFRDSRECEMSLTEAFTEIKRVLSKLASDTGKSWTVTTDDTNKTLIADTCIPITGASSQLISPEANLRLKLSFHKGTSSRLLIDLEWQPLQPNLDPQTFESLKATVNRILTPVFSHVEKTPSLKLKTPPAWIHTATLVCTIAYSVSCARTMEMRLSSQEKVSESIKQSTESLRREIRALEGEYSEWQRFRQNQSFTTQGGPGE